MSDRLHHSWIPVPAQSDFPLENIPFGIFSDHTHAPRPCTRVGDVVVDLLALAERHIIKSIPIEYIRQTSLNALFGLGRKRVRLLRQELTNLLGDQQKQSVVESAGALHAFPDVTMHLPVSVPNYTDFYSSKEHATNVGIMFRDPDNALLPNWKHIPVGYHGRASSIIVSGQPIHRPLGQMKADDAEFPTFGPSRLLDFELEMAFITCSNTALGSRIPVAEAEDHIIGMVLFNDWSARDIQKWEYVPLGPFLGKNFGSSVSPWVVTLDALEPFRVAGPKQDPPVLPYLQQSRAGNFDIQLQVILQPTDGAENTISRSNYKYMYWSMAQQLAHHTVNGCNILVGDMYGSGTISGPTPDSYGSMLELTWRGTNPITLSDGTTRKFLQDGDTLILRGHAEKEGLRIGFGEVRTTILPAK